MRTRAVTDLTYIVGRLHAIAEPANGFDEVDADLLAKTSDKDLNGVGIAIEILVITCARSVRSAIRPRPCDA